MKQQALLRPRRLALAAAVTLLTGSALAQTSAAAEVSPGIAGVVSVGTPIQLLGENFNGTEGPLAWPDGSVLFTETNAQRITRIAPDGRVSPFLERSNGANGLALTAGGDLIAVQVQQPRVGIVYPAGHERVLAEGFEGRPFGRPNDLVLDRQGNIYFTDSGANPAPAVGGTAAASAPQPAVVPAPPAVYRLNAKGALQRLLADVERPNGIQLSPDERVLYLANSNGDSLLAYDILPDGSLGPQRRFARLVGQRALPDGRQVSGADGLAVDALGRVYVATAAGVEVFNEHGIALGVISLPKPPQNLAFAGADKRSLVIVGRGSTWQIATLTPGYNGRAK